MHSPGEDAELQQQVERLALFLEVSTALFSTLDLQKILHTVMDKIRDLLQPDTCALLMVDQKTLELYFETAVGRGAETLKDVRLQLGEGLAGWAAAHQECVLVEDLEADERCHRLDELPQPNAQSVLCVPIKGHEQVLGVIELVNFAGHPGFLAPHVPTLKSLADYTGMALENASYFRRMQELTILDDCTALYNSRHLDFVLDAEIYRSTRHGYKFSVVFFDLDHFKQVNDLYGHLVGSKLLWMIGSLIKSHLRLSDYAFRYGGDEFVIVLPQTPKEGAHQMLRRLKGLLDSAVFFQPENLNIKVTASFGIATFPDDSRTRQELLRLADEAMYHVKKTTRNAIGLAGEGAEV